MSDPLYFSIPRKTYTFVPGYIVRLLFRAELLLIAPKLETNQISQNDVSDHNRHK